MRRQQKSQRVTAEVRGKLGKFGTRGRFKKKGIVPTLLRGLQMSIAWDHMEFTDDDFSGQCFGQVMAVGRGVNEEMEDKQ